MKKKTSEIIRGRLELAQQRFFCNDNIADYIKAGELKKLEDEVAENMEVVLQSLVIDTAEDHNTKETAHRVAKMFVQEIFSGRYIKAPKVTAFPNSNSYDQLYVTGPITVRSTCAHHIMPIVGRAYIGIFPGEKVIGLSKFNRLTEWIGSRPQIQEEMTVQLADEIEAETSAEGVAVLVQAEHFCLSHRGVKEHENDMTTSVLRGSLRDDLKLRQEFFSILSGMKGFGK